MGEQSKPEEKPKREEGTVGSAVAEDLFEAMDERDRDGRAR